MLPLSIFFLFINIPFFFVPSVSLLLFPHLFLHYFTFILCCATAVPFSSSTLSSPAAVDCLHQVSNLSLHFYICYTDFFVLSFVMSSLIVTAKARYLRIFVTQSATRHHYNWNPRRRMTVMIIICCLLKMLKFHTAAFGSKC